MQLFKLIDEIGTFHRFANHQCKTFLTIIIDNTLDPESRAIEEHILNKIHTPHSVAEAILQTLKPMSTRTVSTRAFRPKIQSLFPIHSIHPLVIVFEFFPAKQNEESSEAITNTRLGNVLQTYLQEVIIFMLLSIVIH